MDMARAERSILMNNDGGQAMLQRGSVVAVNVALALCLIASQASAEVFAYPKRGQSQQQFEQDQFACHQWAQGQTGASSSQAAPPPERGGAVRGAGRGAAAGAIGGAIGGNAAKGAAIGAAVGGTTGGVRQAGRNQQAQQQAQAASSAYDRAYAGCMAGRGYQVS
jgi:OmpA family protein